MSVDFDELKRRAERNDSQACYDLGCALHDGDDVLKRNRRAAIAWLEHSAELGHGAACRRLAWIACEEHSDWNGSVSWNEKGAVHKDVGCMVNLGNLYARRGPVHLRTAIDWYERALSHGADVDIALGGLLLSRECTHAENLRGAELITRGSAGHYMDARCALRHLESSRIRCVVHEHLIDEGAFPFFPSRGRYFPATPREELTTLAESGDARALSDLGLSQYWGPFPDEDGAAGYLHAERLEEAMHLLVAAAEQHEPQAAFALGCIKCSTPGYLSLREAVQHFEVAATGQVKDAHDALCWLNANAAIRIDVLDDGRVSERASVALCEA
ncbi:MAG: sel1 repeat family protein [Deltaproteobacteria bacterium]|nr:sel1 repeat family protein [Deltaproteobacteria bacterium]